MRRALVPLLAAAATAWFAACARQGAPSGGPQDHRPPVIVAVRPDTFARIEAGGGRIRIQFDEPLAEAPSEGTLDQAVQLSPRTGEVSVRHKGDAIEVSIAGGFQAGVIYRVTVLPVIQDRFRNTMLDAFEWVFTTGPEFQANALAGEVWDRVSGDPVPALDVFAVSDDSVRYVARTDSLGLFVMRYLPLGEYQLRSFDDRNRNDVADPFEIQGVGERLSLGATDTTLTSFWVMVPDTTPPQFARAEKVDSSTLRLIFDDALDPDQNLEGIVIGMYRDSGNTPGVLQALHPYQYDARVDSLAEARAAEARADPEAVQEPPVDTGGVELPVVAPTPRGVVPQSRQGPTQREFLPDGRRVPKPEVVLLLRGVIEGGSLYTVRLGPVTNISGLTSEPAEGVFRLPADALPPPPDTAVADTAVADTAVADTMSLRSRVRRPRP